MISLLRLIFRDASFLKLGKDRFLILKPEADRIRKVAEKYSASALLLAQEKLSQTEKEIVFNANFAQCIELFMAHVLSCKN